MQSVSLSFSLARNDSLFSFASLQKRHVDNNRERKKPLTALPLSFSSDFSRFLSFLLLHRAAAVRRVASRNYEGLAPQSPIWKIANAFLPFADRRRNDFFFVVDRSNASHITPANSLLHSHCFQFACGDAFKRSFAIIPRLSSPSPPFSLSLSSSLSC